MTNAADSPEDFSPAWDKRIEKVTEASQIAREGLEVGAYLQQPADKCAIRFRPKDLLEVSSELQNEALVANMMAAIEAFRAHILESKELIEKGRLNPIDRLAMAARARDLIWEAMSALTKSSDNLKVLTDVATLRQIPEAEYAAMQANLNELWAQPWEGPGRRAKVKKKREPKAPYKPKYSMTNEERYLALKHLSESARKRVLKATNLKKRAAFNIPFASPEKAAQRELAMLNARRRVNESEGDESNVPSNEAPQQTACVPQPPERSESP